MISSRLFLFQPAAVSSQGENKTFGGVVMKFCERVGHKCGHGIVYCAEGGREGAFRLLGVDVA